MNIENPQFYIKTRDGRSMDRLVITGIGVMRPDVATDGSTNIIYGRRQMEKVIKSRKPIYGPTPEHILKVYANPKTTDSEVGAYFPEGFDPFAHPGAINDLSRERMKSLREPDASLSARLAAVASNQAVLDAGLDPTKLDPRETGVAISTSTSPVEIIETALREIRYQIEPHDVVETRKREYTKALKAATGNGLTDEAIRISAKILGIRGRAINNATACASSLANAVDAANAIRAHQVEKMLVGGAESVLGHVWTNVFRFSGVAAVGFNDKPKEASRPGDKDRSGLVPGEGGVVFMLEKLATVVKDDREDHILMELHSGTTTIDPEGVTTTSFRATSEAISKALWLSDFSGTDATFPHMTSTKSGDIEEALAILETNPNTTVYPGKALLAHSFAAAGAERILEAAIAFADQRLPEPVNLHNIGTLRDGKVDPEGLGGLRFSFEYNQPHTIDTAIAQAIGMQGVNAAFGLLRYIYDRQF